MSKLYAKQISRPQQMKINYFITIRNFNPFTFKFEGKKTPKV